MKNLFKIFFTIFILFISIFVSGKISHSVSFGLHAQPVIELKSLEHHQNLAQSNNQNETSLAAANTRGFGISALQDRKNNNNYAGFGKSNSQAKAFQQFFSKNYNNLTYSISHKISSYLKNEICTRAP